MAEIIERVFQPRVIGYTCDSCRQEFTDIMDTQEFLHYRHRGGYTSVFGDGTEVSLDLCQRCVKKLLGGVIQCYDSATMEEDEEPTFEP
jgi:hypothetical protein